MNSISLCNLNGIDLNPLKPLFHNPILRFPNHNTLNFPFDFKSPPLKSAPFKHRRCRTISSASDFGISSTDIDMIKTKEGIFTAKPKKVVVLWDLDNKPPRGPPYEAALSLKRMAQCFGDIIDISAYANRHAFIHLPQWVREERRERRHLDILERKGVATPPEPYICGVCGRKCKTNIDLKKHFRQLHEREREKKLNRMRSLKGKKRQRFKERFIDGNHKYQEAAKTLIKPKVGYGLASELRRAGVFVKTVEDKPQAADWAVKRQMMHSMSSGVDWLFLISDDSDFSDMLRRARESNLGTVVVGDMDRALGRHADLWVPWIGVENGEISEEDLLLKSRRNGCFLNDDNRSSFSSFSVTDFVGEVKRKEDMDSVIHELVEMRSEFNSLKVSAFSDGEDDWANGNARLDVLNSLDNDDDLFSDGYDDLFSDSDDDLFSDSDDEF